MNRFSLAGAIVRSIDAVWSLADDFAPWTTLKEASALLRETRQSYFDRTFNEQDAALGARLHALRQAQAILATRLDRGETSPFAETATQTTKVKVETRLRTLMAIADPSARGRDPLAGTLLTTDPQPLAPFQRLADHGTPTEFLRGQVQRLAEDTLGSRDLRDLTVARRVRAEERMRLLAELDAQVATATAVVTTDDGGEVHRAASAVIASQLDATRVALDVVSARPRPPKPEPPPAPMRPTATPPPAGGEPAPSTTIFGLDIRLGRARRRIQID